MLASWHDDKPTRVPYKLLPASHLPWGDEGPEGDQVPIGLGVGQKGMEGSQDEPRISALKQKLFHRPPCRERWWASSA